MKLTIADKRLLETLGENARISWVQLAERVNLSASACQRRVESMLSSGLIRKFTVDIDAESLGQAVTSIISVKVERQAVARANAFRDTVATYPEVRNFYKLSGSVDYMLTVTAPDIRALSDFIDNKLLAIDGVVDASSAIVLDDLPCHYKPFA
ncbi:MAG: Lrp/AsnC family transcriptional regulator [Maricaulaceae bacterium]